MTKKVAPTRPRPTRSSGNDRVSALALAVPLEVMMEHGALETLDLLTYLIAFNRQNQFLVVEALAGCGKTSMLTGLVKRLGNEPRNGVLLLSFTRAAVRVARMRLKEDGISLKTQTFDSLIYHAVRYCLGEDQLADDFQAYRELSMQIETKTLEDFECRAWVKYDLTDIQYILVDEAQDTPPEALSLLRHFRDMGKTVIITGDRNQAIFQFMNTQSLFDTLAPHEKVSYTLRKTRRCGYHVAEYVNRRFSLDMIPTSTATDPGPTKIKTVCIQARSNRTLARLYAQMLFALDYPCKVYVAKNESETIFWDTLVQETCQRYSLSPDTALVAIHDRQENQQYYDLILIFSTTHHFKGGECDVTILSEDLAVSRTSAATEEERVKYTACTRARWGVLDLDRMEYHGHPRARQLLSDAMSNGRSHGGLNNVSCVGSVALCQVQLALAPSLEPLFQECRRVVDAAPPVQCDNPIVGRTASDVSMTTILKTLMSWTLERDARHHGAAIYTASPEFQVHLFHDRRYKTMVRDEQVERSVHKRLKRRLASLKWQVAVARTMVVYHGLAPTSRMAIKGAEARAILMGFVLSRNVTRLKPARSHRAVVRYLCHDMLQYDALLQDPLQWKEVHLHQNITQGALEVQGCVDAVVVDQDQRWHLYDFKVSKSVRSIAQLLQLHMATACVHINHGYPVHRAVLYNLWPQSSTAMVDISPSVSSQMFLMDPESTLMANDAMRWKAVYQYYKSSHEESDIVGTL